MTTGAAFAASGHAPWADDAGPASSTHAADPTLPTHPTHTSGRPSDGSSPSTGPNVHAFGGLCRAYNSGNKAEHGKALESPAFAALVVAAGGTDNVATYCSTVTTGPSGSHPSHPAHPTQAVTPTHPTQGETERSHPTQAVTPTEPTRPSQATTPTKPARPTQAPTPTHPAP